MMGCRFCGITLALSCTNLAGSVQITRYEALVGHHLFRSIRAHHSVSPSRSHNPWSSSASMLLFPPCCLYLFHSILRSSSRNVMDSTSNPSPCSLLIFSRVMPSALSLACHLWLLSFGSFSRLARISSSTCGFSCKSTLPASH